ncbi:zinc metalloprotease HtpX [Microvirga massiliensis]|uniref:zinc metalloprotease HtpX n=1 Tax=Microvirga massiliensis TaxID=1033741 RepID=UPI00062BD95D|nr:zinc metalloprotease HtpX [Microvirga massiliensis]
MMISPLNERERIRHKWRNRLQSILLLAGMAVLLSLCGWALAGADGVFWAFVTGALSLLFGPQVSPWLTLRMYGAVPVHPSEMPALFQLVERISGRAGLPHPPRLHYVPTRILNAFAVGRRDDAALAVTEGLLRILTLRELAGVLAHEISHIRNNDLGIMTLADVISRLTSAMWLAGMVLLIASLPVLLTEGNAVPWLSIALLVLSPTIASLLQLALSRTREYDADLDAAGLTGDPRGLASALEKLERYQGGLFETLLLPGRRVPQPSLLRTHPPTRDRIARLLALEAEAPPRFGGPAPTALPERFRNVPSTPRWRATGLWY